MVKRPEDEYNDASLHDAVKDIHDHYKEGNEGDACTLLGDILRAAIRRHMERGFKSMSAQTALLASQVEGLPHILALEDKNGATQIIIHGSPVTCIGLAEIVKRALLRRAKDGGNIKETPGT